MKNNNTFTSIGNKGLNKSMFIDSGLDDLIVKSQNPSEEVLKKADVDRAFSETYGDQKINVSKTGKEIKTGLATKKSTLTTKKQILEDKKIALIDELATLGCKDSPDEIPYQAKDNDDDSVKKFSWEVRGKYDIPWAAQQALKNLEKKDDEGCEENAMATMSIDTNDKGPTFTNDQIIKFKKYRMIDKKMREFNDLVDVCYGVVRDLAVIETMLNNIKDSASYNLNIRQLQAAGL